MDWWAVIWNCFRPVLHRQPLGISGILQLNLFAYLQHAAMDLPSVLSNLGYTHPANGFLPLQNKIDSICLQ